jgi:N-acyl-D-amino-acid deacylase
MRIPLRHLGLIATMLLAAAPGAVRAQAGTGSWVITGAQVADGTGKPLRQVHVRIEGDKITGVGKLKPRKNETVVHGDGLVLAPGFIDTHNHSDRGLQDEPEAVSQVSQGLTTLLLGQDGGSVWPTGEYLEARRKTPPAVNVATMVGHATVRRMVMGDDFRRTATGDEITRMQALVEQAIREGALGLSSGLEYEVGSYAGTDELVALAQAAQRAGGRLYISHIRDEADKSLEAMREAITIGERSKMPAQITHIKLGTVGVWGKAAEAVKLIEEARRRGVDVTADCYPYTAWQSNLKVLVPNKQWKDAASVKRALDDVGGGKNISITHLPMFPQFVGQSIAAVAQAEGSTEVDVYMKLVDDDHAGVIGHTMTEEDLRAFYQQPWTMVSSDGAIGGKHPRGAGTFPRVLARFVREKKWLTLEEAIRKMTSLPAGRLGLKDRGIIKKGLKADLVLFNPETVTDHATFADPLKLSTGIEKVYVNGQLVWSAGRSTGLRPGRVLAR